MNVFLIKLEQKELIGNSKLSSSPSHHRLEIMIPSEKKKEWLLKKKASFMKLILQICPDRLYNLRDIFKLIILRFKQSLLLNNENFLQLETLAKQVLTLKWITLMELTRLEMTENHNT